MSPVLNPAAPHQLPFFITAPGSTDVLMVISAIVLVAAVLGAGVVFLHIHSLPERMAHRGQKLQFEIVAVLCLLALLTHSHAFWVVALLLAVIEVPDFLSPVKRIARAAEHMAGIAPPPRADDPPQAHAPAAPHAGEAHNA